MSWCLCLVENNRTIRVSVSPKVGCTSIRHWIWKVLSRKCYEGSDIYKDLSPMYFSDEDIVSSAQITIAVHRSGVSRLRSVYDHRVRHEGDAEDRGILDFARRLDDYSAYSENMAHHMAPQREWLGDNPDAFTDILPLHRLDLLPEIVGKALGRKLPPLPRVHEIKDKSEISPEVAELFDQWCARDTEIGWDGETMKLSGIADVGRRIMVPGWGDGILIEIPGVVGTVEVVAGFGEMVEVESGNAKPLNETLLRKRRYLDYQREWESAPERVVARVANPWVRVRDLAFSLRERGGRFGGMALPDLLRVVREDGGVFHPGELEPQLSWLLDDRGCVKVEVYGKGIAPEHGELEESFDEKSNEWVRKHYAIDLAVFGELFRNEKDWRLTRDELEKRVAEGLKKVGISSLAMIRPGMRKFDVLSGRELAGKYKGLKEWGWYLDDLEGWRDLLSTRFPIRALEVGAFDGVSANLMLEALFRHPKSEVHCIDPYLHDPTTPRVGVEVREQFLKNQKIGERGEAIQLYEGLSVEVLAWMIANEGYWESFDFIYIDGSHLAANVITDAVMSWPLLKVGGVIAFDDYEWGNGESLKAPKQAIDAFEKLFAPRLELLRGGGRKIWRKV
jgi:predicted O-methyltransferase YrrM